MKPGDRVIWVRSPGRSILEAWNVEQVPGVVVGVCRHRVKICVRLGETDRLVTVDPENLIGDDGTGEFSSQQDNSGLGIVTGCPHRTGTSRSTLPERRIRGTELGLGLSSTGNLAGFSYS